MGWCRAAQPTVTLAAASRLVVNEYNVFILCTSDATETVWAGCQRPLPVYPAILSGLLTVTRYTVKKRPRSTPTQPVIVALGPTRVSSASHAHLHPSAMCCADSARGWDSLTSSTRPFYPASSQRRDIPSRGGPDPPPRSPSSWVRGLGSDARKRRLARPPTSIGDVLC